MPDEHDDLKVDEPDQDRDREDEGSDDAPASAKTRAGSNVPNAAGNRGDGEHE